jgi:hypothetical protein
VPDEIFVPQSDYFFDEVTFLQGLVERGISISAPRDSESSRRLFHVSGAEYFIAATAVYSVGTGALDIPATANNLGIPFKYGLWSNAWTSNCSS